MWCRPIITASRLPGAGFAWLARLTLIRGLIYALMLFQRIVLRTVQQDDPDGAEVIGQTTETLQ